MNLDSYLYEDTFVKKLKCPVHKNKLSAKKVSIHLSDGMVYNHLVNYCRNCDAYYFRFSGGDKILKSNNLVELSKEMLRTKPRKYSIKDIEKISETG